MGTISHFEERIEQENFSSVKLQDLEYEQCTFKGCNFSETAFSRVAFIECQFVDCNFSMAKLNDTALRDVRFVQCKLMGVVFDHCHSLLFRVRFDQSILDYCSFSGLKMKQTPFTGCSMVEVQFVESDLTGSLFVGCDLLRAQFQQVILEKVDFTTARNFIIDPNQNRMKKATFSLAGLPGLLQSYGIVVE
ncbi:MAG TPA: pentapeptide repeat-containing protein [Prolixibacteraceae bacterium]|nr:pentapeptide repeat-containing protein [Prolixibacteraceae bacterium]HPS12154.1 pentapeptide repeat-containing protein [Prolixibacteraceae bacterium]